MHALIKKQKVFFSIIIQWLINYSRRPLFFFKKEITFLNKKYIGGKKAEYINKFPVKGLDYPCNPYKEDLTFSFE